MQDMRPENAVSNPALKSLQTPSQMAFQERQSPELRTHTENNILSRVRPVGKGKMRFRCLQGGPKGGWPQQVSHRRLYRETWVCHGNTEELCSKDSCPGILSPLLMYKSLGREPWWHQWATEANPKICPQGRWKLPPNIMHITEAIKEELTSKT